MVEIDEIREEQMEELMRDTSMYIRRNTRSFSLMEQSGQGGEGGQGEQEEAGHLKLVVNFKL